MSSATVPAKPELVIPKRPLSERLLSLDLLRGITIAGMILVNDAGDEPSAYWPLKHAQWNGWTPTDLVFPFFLFMVGVAMTFSLSSRMKRGESRGQLMQHALGDPTRRAIVEQLSTGPVSVSSLAKPLAITLAAVVQHLQILEMSGLVRTTKIGRVRTCRMESKGLSVAEQWIEDRRSVWEKRFDRLGKLLEESDKD